MLMLDVDSRVDVVERLTLAHDTSRGAVAEEDFAVARATRPFLVDAQLRTSLTSERLSIVQRPLHSNFVKVCFGDKFFLQQAFGIYAASCGMSISRRRSARAMIRWPLAVTR